MAPGVSFDGFVSGAYAEADGHIDALATVTALVDRTRDPRMTCRYGESEVGFEIGNAIQAVDILDSFRPSRFMELN